MEQPHYLKPYLDELLTKLEEADINDRLARICRKMDGFAQILKERDTFTPAETAELEDLTRKYKEEFERYIRLKGLADKLGLHPYP